MILDVATWELIGNFGIEQLMHASVLHEARRATSQKNQKVLLQVCWCFLALVIMLSTSLIYMHDSMVPPHPSQMYAHILPAHVVQQHLQKKAASSGLLQRLLTGMTLVWRLKMVGVNSGFSVQTTLPTPN